MPDKAWKRAERNAAHLIGGVRTPLSGGSSHHTRADVIHPVIYLEMKYRQRFTVVSQMEKEEIKAKKEGKVAVLGFQQRGKKTRYYLIPESLMSILMAHLPTAVKLTSSASFPEHQSQQETPPQESSSTSLPHQS